MASIIFLIKKLWIDESGDCGFKFNRGSSRFLVIVAVYLTGKANINKEISKLRSDRNYEFKFSKSSNKTRKALLSLIGKLPIEYKAIVVDKQKLSLKLKSQQLYCELIRRLFYDNNPKLEKAILILDEATSKIHHREFNNILKRYLSKNIIAKIRQKRSKGEIMIQVADMICGSIFRKYEKHEDKYYQIIKNKEKILIEF